MKILGQSFVLHFPCAENTKVPPALLPACVTPLAEARQLRQAPFFP